MTKNINCLLDRSREVIYNQKAEKQVSTALDQTLIIPLLVFVMY